MIQGATKNEEMHYPKKKIFESGFNPSYEGEQPALSQFQKLRPPQLNKALTY